MPTKLLEKIGTLQQLSEKSKSLLLSKIKLLTVKKNEILLNQGQKCKHIYFTETGFLKTATFNKAGKEVNLSFTLESNFTTNLKSLRQGTPSENYIQACENSTIISFEKNDLFDLYQQSEEISTFGRNLLEQLLAEQEEHANLFKLKSPAERYQHILKNNVQLLQKISVTQLSSYLGISRETLSRIRKAI